MITRRKFLGAAASSILSAHPLNNISLPFFNYKKQKLKIVFITDLHLQSQKALIEKTCIKAAKKINAEKADIVICGGDCIHRGIKILETEAEESFKIFKNFWQQLPSSSLIIPGNHDYTKFAPNFKPDLQLFSKHIPLAVKESKEIDLGSAVLFTLPTIVFNQKDDSYFGNITPEIIKWLKNRFASHPSNKTKIILTHMPLITSLHLRTEEKKKEFWLVKNSTELFDIIGENNSTVILQGHLHVNELLSWNKTHSIIGGAMCGKWWNGDFHGTRRGFGVLTINGGSIDWDYKEI